MIKSPSPHATIPPVLAPPQEDTWQWAEKYFKAHPEVTKLSKKMGHGQDNDAFLKSYQASTGNIFSHSFIAIKGKIFALSANRFALGAGAVGRVKPCYNREGKMFAVKVAKIKSDEDAQSISNEFKKECQVLAKLGRALALVGCHYHSSNSTSAEVVKSKIYLFQSYVDGQSLADYLELMKKEGGHLSEEVASKIALLCVEQLIALHHHGILHGDVSSKNIMLNSESPLSTMLVDFGCAKIFEEGKDYVDDYAMDNYSTNPAFMLLIKDLLQTDREGESYIRWTPAYDVYCLHSVFEDLGLPTHYNDKEMAAVNSHERPTLLEIQAELAQRLSKEQRSLRKSSPSMTLDAEVLWQSFIEQSAALLFSGPKTPHFPIRSFVNSHLQSARDVASPLLPQRRLTIG